MGTFKIPLSILELPITSIPYIQQLMSHVIILRIKYDDREKTFNYLARSELFDLINDTEPTPHYSPLFNLSTFTFKGFNKLD